MTVVLLYVPGPLMLACPFCICERGVPECEGGGSGGAVAEVRSRTRGPSSSSGPEDLRWNGTGR